MYEDEILRMVKEENPQNPLAFVSNIVKPLAIEKLNECIQSCKDCNICNTVKTITKGDPNSPIMIIGESSSIEQQFVIGPDLPFNNEAGNILDKVFNKLNIDQNKLFFINSVCCFPHRMDNNSPKKRSPTVNERKNCKTFVDYAIKVVDPLLIICLGNVATNDINEDFGKQAISKIRGKYFNYRGITVMPTYHPQYFVELDKANTLDEEYIASLTWDFFNDLKKAFDDFKKKYPDIDINC